MRVIWSQNGDYLRNWGLSFYSKEDGEVFLGHSVTQQKLVSDDTAHLIDQEVRRIIDHNYDLASSLLEENIALLHLMANALIKYETINSLQISDIMEGKAPRPPQEWYNATSSSPPLGSSTSAENSSYGKNTDGIADFSKLI